MARSTVAHHSELKGHPGRELYMQYNPEHRMRVIFWLLCMVRVLPFDATTLDASSGEAFTLAGAKTPSARQLTQLEHECTLEHRSIVFCIAKVSHAAPLSVTPSLRGACAPVQLAHLTQRRWQAPRSHRHQRQSIVLAAADPAWIWHAACQIPEL